MIREKQCEERCKVKSNVEKGAKKKGIQRNEIQIRKDNEKSDVKNGAKKKGVLSNV